MISKPFHLFRQLNSPFALLLILFIIAGCGGGDSSTPSAGGGSPGPGPQLSLPLPKSLLAPSSASGLILTAKAIIDPGKADARTVPLTVDIPGNRVTGVIDGISPGAHSIEIQYFINDVQVAIAALNVDVVAGQNNTVELSETLIHYMEAVSNTLAVGDSANQSIAFIDHYSDLPGGQVLVTPRIVGGPATGLTGLSPGGLFIEPIGGVLYATNDAPDPQVDSVRIWNDAANIAGDVPPSRVLAGPATGLNHPTGIAVDPFHKKLYVINQTGELLIWNNDPSLNGEVGPAMVVTNTLTLLGPGDHPVYLDLENDTLYVGNGGGIVLFQKIGQATTLQDLVVNPISIAGATLSEAGVAFDSNRNTLFVSSRDPNGTIYALPQLSPTVTALTGPETGLNKPSALSAANNILMAANQGGNQIRVWQQADQKKDNASPTQILDLPSSSVPSSLFYVATQNAPQDQAGPVLTVSKTGNGHGRVISDLPGINCGTTCSAPFAVGNRVILTVTADDDSIFTGWSEACSGTDACVVTMDAAKSVTAIFTLQPFALSVSKVGTGSGTVTSNPLGIDCGNDCGETYGANARVTLTATPDANSNFSGWSGACNGTGTCLVTIDAAKSVIAAFNLKPILTVTKIVIGTGAGGTVSGTGINCGIDCTESYNNSTTTVTLSASSNGISNFTGWSGACTDVTGSCVVTMDAAKTVTASFTLKPVLTVVKAGAGGGTITGSGISCGTGGTDCTEAYNNFNTQVTLTATAATGSAPGSRFTGWSGACSNATGTCVVTMDDAKTVTATFVETFQLTLSKSTTGTGTGTVSTSPAGINCGAGCSTASAAFVRGIDVGLIAVPADGSTFVGWTGTGDCTDGRVTMTAARNCIATFNITPSTTITTTSTTITTIPTTTSTTTTTPTTTSTTTSTTTTQPTTTTTLQLFRVTITKTGSGSGTVTSSPAGINCGPTCEANFFPGADVTLGAHPDEGSLFTTWTGDIDCSDGMVKMDGAKNCTATFILVPTTTTSTTTTTEPTTTTTESTTTTTTPTTTTDTTTTTTSTTLDTTTTTSTLISIPLPTITLQSTLLR